MPIVNITATFETKHLNFDEVKQLLSIAPMKKSVKRKRKTNAFDQVMIRKPASRIVFLLYRSQRCVCLGSRSIDELHLACNWVQEQLSIEIKRGPDICNIVFSCVSPWGSVSLEQLFLRLQRENPRRAFGYFDPELSPALIYVPRCSPRAKALIFRPGKVNITGVRTSEEAESVAREVEYILRP